ncbi:hypothetical protein B0D71_18100 [Pseudomonas laurylsulfativorans]|uniref:Uncharacterized protein n=2 Tax=Pseudomonas TaxID=286 RepID=A0A2S3VMF9_9PSED|nr:hypothetical protein B0D71_18100 [Pseudomonas laurylsulfativorans]PPK37300.1 hypothetical protein CD175_20930 [Pseudomonas laurylsulfatiphila]
MEVLIFLRYRTEAQVVLAKRTDKRNRFLDSALSNGPEFEPIGCLAGCRQTAAEDHLVNR